MKGAVIRPPPRRISSTVTNTQTTHPTVKRAPCLPGTGRECNEPNGT